MKDYKGLDFGLGAFVHEGSNSTGEHLGKKIPIEVLSEKIEDLPEQDLRYIMQAISKRVADLYSDYEFPAGSGREEITNMAFNYIKEHFRTDKDRLSLMINFINSNILMLEREEAEVSLSDLSQDSGAFLQNMYETGELAPLTPPMEIFEIVLSFKDLNKNELRRLINPFVNRLKEIHVNCEFLEGKPTYENAKRLTTFLDDNLNSIEMRTGFTVACLREGIFDLVNEDFRVREF